MPFDNPFSRSLGITHLPASERFACPRASRQSRERCRGNLISIAGFFSFFQIGSGPYPLHPRNRGAGASWGLCGFQRTRRRFDPSGHRVERQVHRRFAGNSSTRPTACARIATRRGCAVGLERPYRSPLASKSLMDVSIKEAIAANDEFIKELQRIGNAARGITLQE